MGSIQVRKVLALTIHDRNAGVLQSVMASFKFPGNSIDVVAVCYDRVNPEVVDEFRNLCKGYELREVFLDDDVVGPRCSSKSWNSVLGLVSESHAFCISSDVVMAPHSVGMAYELSRVCPGDVFCGMTIHSGPSYYWLTNEMGDKCRIMTWSRHPNPLGFCWLLPMDAVRKIGGYSEEYMDGVCFEDDDFVRRMWGTGINFVFCDDILGMHMEHNREQYLDIDGKVSINKKIHLGKYGDSKALSDMFVGSELIDLSTTDVQNSCTGMSILTRSLDDARAVFPSLSKTQRRYGYSEPWFAFR